MVYKVKHNYVGKNIAYIGMGIITIYVVRTPFQRMHTTPAMPTGILKKYNILVNIRIPPTGTVTTHTGIILG